MIHSQDLRNDCSYSCTSTSSAAVVRPAVSQSPGKASTHPDAGAGPEHLCFFQNTVGGSDDWFNLGSKT